MKKIEKKTKKYSKQTSGELLLKKQKYSQQLEQIRRSQGFNNQETKLVQKIRSLNNALEQKQEYNVNRNTRLSLLNKLKLHRMKRKTFYNTNELKRQLIRKKTNKLKNLLSSKINKYGFNIMKNGNTNKINRSKLNNLVTKLTEEQQAQLKLIQTGRKTKQFVMNGYNNVSKKLDILTKLSHLLSNNNLQDNLQINLKTSNKYKSKINELKSKQHKWYDVSGKRKTQKAIAELERGYVLHRKSELESPTLGIKRENKPQSYNTRVQKKELALLNKLVKPTQPLNNKNRRRLMENIFALRRLKSNQSVQNFINLARTTKRKYNSEIARLSKLKNNLVKTQKEGKLMRWIRTGKYANSNNATNQAINKLTTKIQNLQNKSSTLNIPSNVKDKLSELPVKYRNVVPSTQTYLPPE